MPAATRNQSDTLKLLTALGRALGANVEVRPRAGRPPRREPLDKVMSAIPTLTINGVTIPFVPGEAKTTPKRRKLRPNPQSLRRRLAKARSESEVLEVLEEIRSTPRSRKHSPHWNRATIKRYLPPAFKHVADRVA